MEVLEFEFTDTLNLPEPKSLTLAEAELEISVINANLRALSAQAAPYRRWLRRLNRRIVALNRQKHSLQVYIEVGITKIPEGVRGTEIPKVITKEDFEAYLATLTPESLAAVQESLYTQGVL